EHSPALRRLHRGRQRPLPNSVGTGGRRKAGQHAVEFGEDRLRLAARGAAGQMLIQAGSLVVAGVPVAPCRQDRRHSLTECGRWLVHAARGAKFLPGCEDEISHATVSQTGRDSRYSVPELSPDRQEDRRFLVWSKRRDDAERFVFVASLFGPLPPSPSSISLPAMPQREPRRLSVQLLHRVAQNLASPQPTPELAEAVHCQRVRAGFVEKQEVDVCIHLLGVQLDKFPVRATGWRLLGLSQWWRPIPEGRKRRLMWKNPRFSWKTPFSLSKTWSLFRFESGGWSREVVGSLLMVGAFHTISKT